MYLKRMVIPARGMIEHNLFNSRPIKIGPCKSFGIKKKVLDIIRQHITIPNAKMIEFMSSQKHILDM